MPLPLVEIPEQAASDDIDEDILEIFLEECEEVLEDISSSYGSWKDNASDQEALQTLRRAFHTLKGSGRLVGAMAIGELGWWFESMLNRVIDGSMSRNSLVLGLLDQVESTILPMIEQFKNGKAPDYSAILLMSQAKHLTETKGAELGEFEAAPEGKAEESAEESTEKTVDLDEGIDLDAASEIVELEADAEADFSGTGETVDLEETEIVPASDEDQDLIDPAVMDIFKDEAAEHLATLKNFIINCRRKPKKPCVPDSEVFRAAHTLNGSARNMALIQVADLAKAMESYLRTALDQQVALDKPQVSLYIDSGKMLETLLSNKEYNEEEYLDLIQNWEHFCREILPEEESEETDTPPPPASEPAEVIEEATVAPEAAPEAVDEFLDIFLEEAEEILETSQSLVGRWLASPNSMPLLKELQRELHTLKGGSRMVGITVMGDLSHQLESVLTKIVEGNAQSNPTLQSLVQESLDQLAGMLEAVRGGETLEPATQLIEQIGASLEGGAEAVAAIATPPKKAKPAEKPDKSKPAATTSRPEKKPAEEKPAEISAPASDGGESDERVRVRAGLIDRLTNLAGELSILRAYIEQQQGSVKANLAEMNETVVRLKDQLRRLEIETEAQIISTYRSTEAEEQDDDFDPLEMDQFSGMQQLSRSLMESVSDLQNIQDNLGSLTRRTDGLLIQQSRVGTDLQDSIMRTRMVPFSQITPRLQRIARLTSKELHKQVKFSINDDSIEFERTVLNRVVAPLEHMLRNAIGHGIEEPDEREKSGKPQVAKVHIEILQEGAELILKLSDDGAGINLDAIRKKGESRGMLKPGEKISDHDLMQFILEPAFSTAQTITQVSGRGVGMDIAHSEIKQLGGALLIFSERGKGTTFEIRIPMSLTITQSLLVHIGEETMAIPLDNVKAVVRVARDQVADSDPSDPKTYDYMDENYKIIHLADLLGFRHLASVDAPLLPLLLVGSGDQRLALVVDGVEGRKEVVVKSVGAQLGAVNWIAGATILGDGRVVIILDVLTLMRTNLSKQQSFETAIAEPEVPKERVKTIMVVDDSITVRKVTARLLKRQGMEVLTAKDGVDAISQLQETIPDLMLLDVEMPRMDGFELATQIRNDSDETLRTLPIIMITSRTGAKHRERAQKIGINRHLGKPFNEPELLKNINELLSGEERKEEEAEA